MNRSELSSLRAVLREMDDAMCKFAAGVALGGLALIQGSCQNLGAAGLDETGTYFVRVMERSATMLERADEHASRMPSSEDRARWEIELLKSIWRLDAHLYALLASEATLTTGTEATTTSEERQSNDTVL